MKYFTRIKTISDLDKKYRDLQFEHHPDRNRNSPKSIEISQKITEEYYKVKQKLENPPQKTRKRTETPVVERNDEETLAVSKQRFFDEKETKTIAETGARFASAIIRGLAHGLARNYNDN